MTTLEERVASMPTLVPFRLAAACALALTLLVPSVAQAATRAGVPATLRVVAGQKVLAETKLRTGTTAVPTSRAATCFGKANRGSGKPAAAKGATPLGLLARAARTNRSLRPLLVTDAFSFGLGLCAVGGAEPKGEGFWQLRVDHKASNLAGDKVRLKGGDEVLWYLTSGFPAPEELWLKAPRDVARGKPFRVRAWAYDEKGKRKPAAGVKIGGARGRTDGNGLALVSLNRPRRLIARHGKYIPSNRAAVCVAGKCPRG
jgi:hypothetical protein